MRGLVAVALLVLVSGCLEEPAPPVEADVQPDDDDPGRTARQGRGDREPRDRDEEDDERSGNVTLRSYADQFGFTLTSASAFVTIGNIQGYNCATVEGAPYTIVDGTATITWTSQSPLTDTLDFHIQSYFGGDISEAYSGPSPLVVEFSDLEVEADPDFEDALTFAVEVSNPTGAAYELDVTMDLAFEYESDIDVETSLSYC